MTTTPDLSVVLFAAEDPVALNVALLSAERAIAVAGAEGWSIEASFFCSSPRSRAAVWARDRLPPDWTWITGGAPCLGAAYNKAVAETRGRFFAGLEARDAWSANWLAAALRCAVKESAVWRPQLLAAYGAELWSNPGFSFRSQDQTSALPERLLAEDPFPSGFLTARALLEEVPFPLEDPARGLGEPLWWWNCNVAGWGHAHRIVPETLHYRRDASLSPADAALRVPLSPLRIGPTPLALGKERYQDMRKSIE